MKSGYRNSRELPRPLAEDLFISSVAASDSVQSTIYSSSWGVDGALLESPGSIHSSSAVTCMIQIHLESFTRLVETHNHDLPDLRPGPHGHPACSDCGRTIWNDPKVAGAAIVPMDGGIVMVQRAIEPAIGKWSFPSGYVNRGEKIESAVEREVLEECGLNVEIGRLVGLYSEDGNSIILAVYETRIIGGALESADHETLDVGVFKTDNLPELAFDHDRGIVADWLKLQETSG